MSGFSENLIFNIHHLTIVISYYEVYEREFNELLYKIMNTDGTYLWYGKVKTQ